MVLIVFFPIILYVCYRLFIKHNDKLGEVLGNGLENVWPEHSSEQHKYKYAYQDKDYWVYRCESWWCAELYYMSKKGEPQHDQPKNLPPPRTAA